MIEGLLYSQIGYDIGEPMKAYFRSDNENALDDNSYFEILNTKTGEASTFKPTLFGKKWKTNWWVLNFSGIKEPSVITINLYKNKETKLYSSDLVKVDFHIIWNKTIKSVAIDAFEKRAELARNNNGWKDCGSDWREVCSITPPIISLCDLLNNCYEEFSATEQEQLRQQIIKGADYLCSVMDIANNFGLKKGTVVHEIPNYMVVIPSDLGNTVVALTKAATNLSEKYPEKSTKYLQYAKDVYKYILEDLKPIGYVGINYDLHGMEEGQEIPNEFVTKDLLLFLWGGILLWKAGQIQYQDVVINFANEILERQIPESEAQDGLFGHFYMFKSLKFSEKTFTHHHVGHDTGGILPTYLIPFFEMINIWYSHKEAPKWKKMIETFANGYFIPACSQNPFNLLPIGYYKNEGWLNFCGPWHGFNTTIGFTASLAFEMTKYVSDPRLNDIAISNIQWICGLNTGLTSTSFDSCLFWHENIPEGKAVSYSQIMGIGTKSIRCWTDIVGTIPNGFCVNPQFKFTIKPTLENDAPIRFTDEDWVPHSAGFISALIHLNQNHYFSKNHPRSIELINFNKQQ